MKRILCVFILFVFSKTFSQEIVNAFPLELNFNRDYFQIVNDSTKQVTMFISDKKRVKAIRFNQNMQIIDSISTTRAEKKYIDIIGYNKKKNNYRIYWATKKNNEFYTELYDFQNKKVTYNEFQIDFLKERIIQKITINNIFYIITVPKDKSILKFYKFGENGKPEIKELDLSSLNFSKVNSVLYNMFDNSDNYGDKYNLQYISDESQPSLVLSSKKNKLYHQDNNLIFTFDSDNNFTQLLTINLSDYSFNLNFIVKPELKIDEYLNENSNSFIFNDKIFQIRLTPNDFVLSIKNLKGEEIKAYTAKRENEISFKNSDIIQENGSFSSKRILEKSNQFLRKVTNSNPGIICQFVNNYYYITIGSVMDIVNSGGGMMMPMGGGFGAAPTMSFGFSYSYSYQNLISYKGKKVVYINCLFDTNLIHSNGEFKSLAFDKARMFIDNDDELSESTIFNFDRNLYKDLSLFKFNNTLYLGAFNSSINSYKIYSFKD